MGDGTESGVDYESIFDAISSKAANPSSAAEPSETRDDTEWVKPLDKQAYHGVAGDFVGLVAPHTEADNPGILTQFLVAAGNACGRNVYRIADAAEHRLNLNAVLVGKTGHGRKGSAWAQVRRPFKLIAPEWTADRIQSGLSSGEGLIWAVRDPIEKREAIKEKGRATGEYQVVETDPGITDKRLLVIEPEFASVLKVCDRETNILSTTIRQAWDSGDLRTLTKNSPAKATGAHISIIGHITRDELLRGLGSIEAANGFANRFLWIAVKRSKQLPFGGNLKDSDLSSLVVKLRRVIEWCQTPRELTFSDTAREAWIKVYGELSAGRPGLLGAILGRSEAQVLRLACLYAALDCSSTIQLVHLRAALALWEYSDRSAEYIFSDKLGDPDADAILSELRSNPDGLTRTAIRDLFSRNLSADRIERALTSLLASHLAKFETVQTGGRPSELWTATGTTKTTNTTKGQPA